MKIPCEDCICLSVCLQNLDFRKDKDYSYGYKVTWPYYTKCEVLKKMTVEGKIDDVEKNWHMIKQFFLKKKGLL